MFKFKYFVFTTHVELEIGSKTLLIPKSIMKGAFYEIDSIEDKCALKIKTEKHVFDLEVDLNASDLTGMIGDLMKELH